MTPESVMALGYQALRIGLSMAAPMLIAALVSGLVISILQASTQINEMTLSFIPKILAVTLTVVCAGPTLLNMYLDYMRSLFDSLPYIIG
ncbi:MULTISPECIES: flagellar biosynthesis protein FliQ [Tenebrionibacter/Tenebrionicola group]|jgi:flagellar biosynthetic protein FliQ|uniref:Flagellar biosynthetic protein FliQ n=2 Tax=Tenebrionibacter/Tenebrionicola group TaxID=2969848 RepID=A0A8K0XYJ5_9ENTR|nr:MULTISPECIES: flagellar biosynthesis protein FliQ [Tenebrionibacter/Tenebrionicola group]MBK4716733.1 flagellar biosynthesis protein FliQ [Tenebrionibacter intestinalis]MBV4414007.1 flagellar biosynthesis protein FliQ [Tenebrionicola larvae]MBV5096220.1 flagellar biosynthesis protein FliQ [Tenebrionicola larvae]